MSGAVKRVYHAASSTHSQKRQRRRFELREEETDLHSQEIDTNKPTENDQNQQQQRKAVVNGIHKQVFPGEGYIPICTPESAKKLFFYRITESDTSQGPQVQADFDQSEEGERKAWGALGQDEVQELGGVTTIYIGGKDYKFEGFDIVSHIPIPLHNVPPLKSTTYEAYLEEVPFPIVTPTYAKGRPCSCGERMEQCGGCAAFYLPAIEWFYHYVFGDILELDDWLECTSRDKGAQIGCRQFHLYPRFVYRPNPRQPRHLQLERSIEEKIFDRDMSVTEVILYQPDGTWHPSRPVMLSPKDVAEYLMDISSSISISKPSNLLSVLSTIEDYIKNGSGSHIEYQQQAKVCSLILTEYLIMPRTGSVSGSSGGDCKRTRISSGRH